MAFLKFKYQHQLEQLEKLGYTDTKHIKKKLKKYNGDANQVIADYHKRDQILGHQAQSMSVSVQSPHFSPRADHEHNTPNVKSMSSSNSPSPRQHKHVTFHDSTFHNEIDQKSSRALSSTTTPNIPIYSLDTPLQSASSHPFTSLSSIAPSPTANPPPLTQLLQSVTSHTPDLNQHTMDQRASVALYDCDEDEIHTDTDSDDGDRRDDNERTHTLTQAQRILHRGSTLRREDRSAIFSSTPNLLDDDKWVTQIDSVLRENIMDALDDLHVKDINSVYGTLKVRKPQSKMRIERIFNEIKSVRNDLKNDDQREEKKDATTTTKEEEEELSFVIEKVNHSESGVKQEDVKLSTEYVKLSALYRQTMAPLLKNKTKIEIGLEACNEACFNIFQCICMHRIEVIVMIYHMMKSSVLWRRVALSGLMCFDNIYGYQQMYEDFQHLHLIHARSNANRVDFHNLCRKFEAQYPCEIGSCVVFARHYRDRSAVEASKNLYYFNKANDKTTSIQNNKEMILQQHCDKIHSYLLHSMVKFGSESADEVDAAIKRRNAINEYAAGRSFSTVPKEKEKCSDDDDYTLYPGIEEDEEWLSSINVAEDEDIYSLLVEHMGIFRWQALHGFHYDEYRATDTIRPSYRNIKEEVLYNSFHRITTENWNQTLRKAKAFHQSWAGKRIRTVEAGEYCDFISCTCVGWQRDCSISLREVITLKLYTDFDELQFELKKCFRFEQFGSLVDADRRALDREIQSILERRLQDFYHWRMSLQITLKKFGRVIQGMDLYHGVNEKMILYPHASTSALSAFHGPLSTSSSFHVAKTFATDKGMVLAISSMYPRLHHCRAFDASLLSDYPEEQEWLVGFIYTRIRKVHTKEKWDIRTLPPATRLRFSFFVIHLFKLQIFSLSEDLAQLLMKMLDEYLHSKSHTKHNRIQQVLVKKFALFAANQTIARFDDVSYRLRQYFMNKVAQSLRNGKNIYRISFFKIQKIFVNIQQIYLYNYYKLDDELLTNIIRFVQTNHTIKQIKFLYYDYKGEIASEENQHMYCPTEQLNKDKRDKLAKCGWRIIEKHHTNQDDVVYGVTIRLKNER